MVTYYKLGVVAHTCNSKVESEESKNSRSAIATRYPMYQNKTKKSQKNKQAKLPNTNKTILQRKQGEKKKHNWIQKFIK